LLLGPRLPRARPAGACEDLLLAPLQKCAKQFWIECALAKPTDLRSDVRRFQCFPTLNRRAGHRLAQPDRKIDSRTGRRFNYNYNLAGTIASVSET
jgi:hypothetical protein